jgi:negative regulator of flagellin synthesis FlgM
MPIEIGPSAAAATRPAAAVDARIARQDVAAPGGKAAPAAVAAKAAGNAGSVLDAGAPPIDTDRVAVIRKAVEDGHYPVIPARVADAVIAAGLLLRNGK